MDDLSLQELQFESKTSYTFLEEIGRGGMGVVYLTARNSGGVIDYVVLKTLKSLNPNTEKALRKESTLAASLRHENIVKTYGLECLAVSALPTVFVEQLNSLSYQSTGESKKKFRRLQFHRKMPKQTHHIKRQSSEDEQMLLMVTDYIDGMNLRDLHREHINMSLLFPLPFGAFIISRIARGLGYAHDYLVHSAITPQNILINTHGICKLSDFGLAAAISKQPGQFPGRMKYIAPEQLRGAMDTRSDVFSLGTVAYEILTGIPVFKVDPSLSVAEQKRMVEEQLADDIIPPSKVRSDIPQELSEIVEKMLQPRPEIRYQRAVAVANHLEKRYLYSKGYGPTSNSLANYLSIFENKFTMYTEDQLENLSFLKSSKGDIQLKRRLDLGEYTEIGLELFKKKAPALYKRLRERSYVQDVETFQKQERQPWVKVKHLDNVTESFMLGEKPLHVGNDENADVFLKEEDVHADHCTITKEEDSVFIKQSSPEAQVLVNNQAIFEKQLREGDKIKIGDHQLFFIKQGTPQDPETIQVISIESDAELPALENMDDFIVTIKPKSECMMVLMRLVTEILESTDLSDLKKGVIPTALQEALQLARDGENPFNIRFMRTPARLVFYCRWVSDSGYKNLLTTFKKHRQKLINEIEEQVAGPDITTLDEEPSKSQDFILQQDSDEFEADAVPPQEDEDEDFDIDDIDLDNIEIPDEGELDILAALIIVHGFDRIEFRHGLGEIEFVVYI